ncbi:MAG: hypothetical protein DRQ89_15405, partial [Epsilonproteobacteria bacterium]
MSIGDKAQQRIRQANKGAIKGSPISQPTKADRGATNPIKNRIYSSRRLLPGTQDYAIKACMLGML